eukprot:679477-Prymnesium_polylepis.1
MRASCSPSSTPTRLARLRRRRTSPTPNCARWSRARRSTPTPAAVATPCSRRSTAMRTDAGVRSA